jgi:hypothetical protein
MGASHPQTSLLNFSGIGHGKPAWSMKIQKNQTLGGAPASDAGIPPERSFGVVRNVNDHAAQSGAQLSKQIAPIGSAIR